LLHSLPNCKSGLIESNKTIKLAPHIQGATPVIILLCLKSAIKAIGAKRDIKVHISVQKQLEIK
jgi:hypothetical protein